jgi:phage N-6-adenine-methyltransferase
MAAMTIAPVLYSSATEEWPTTPAFFAKLNRRYRFTLDPCAAADNAKCALYFTKEQDGLQQDWGSHRAFVNPPYGKKIAAWVRKCFTASSGARWSLPCFPLAPTRDGFTNGCRVKPR